MDQAEAQQAEFRGGCRLRSPAAGQGEASGLRRRLPWPLALGLALVLASGGALAAEPVAAERRGTAQAAKGEQAGRLALALERLPELVQAAMARSGVPGLAVVVVHNDSTVVLQGHGTRRLGSGLAVDGDTVFQLASLSKPIASTVIAALVGDGTVGWDTPVMDQLPEVAIGGRSLGARVTLRDLLAHRSGLPDHAGDDLEDLGFDRATVLERLSLLDTGNRFRAAYAYTNFGFTAAGEAAARAAGSSWETLSAERLYQPLGMASTSSRHGDYLARSNRADLHQRLNGRWQVSGGRQPDAQSPAGGVSASARDLARWMRLQLNGGRFEGRQLVAAAALAETHRPQMISVPPADSARDPARTYGLGWNVGFTPPDQVRLSHSGAFALGAATAVSLIPSQGLGIAVLTNGTPMGVPEEVIAGFLDLVEHGQVQRDYAALLVPAFAALMKPDYPIVTAPPAAPDLPLERYAGTYANPYLGAVEVAPEGDALVIRLGPERRSAALTPLGQHRFSYVPVGENAGGPSAVSFRIGSGGRSEAVVIDNLNGEGMGSLRRVGPP
ncbi:serine hydrolase [Cyanobium sp. NIES-981]|uniref:serine hydrolase n=1 Tax=Cyanobium sp. NIES-981 TaxID=1851505 RepID=UPI001CEC2F79|nr:serine hydrolase [Cyanobium sp. NIES-981]